MKQPKFLIALLAISVVFAIGMACKSLTSSQTNENTSKSNNATSTANAAGNSKSDDSNAKTSAPVKIEKADFTFTSEDLDKEYTKKGIKSKDLEKFSNKNLAVTGRVTMLVTEKNGSVQPWVTLFAPGIGHGVNCYFDDDNVGQMKMLIKDKNVTIQGFQDDFVVAEVSPMLKHCVVLEGS